MKMGSKKMRRKISGYEASQRYALKKAFTPFAKFAPFGNPLTRGYLQRY
jgi:hypothetical protein